MGTEMFIPWIRQFSIVVLDKIPISFILFCLFLWVIVVLIRTFLSALFPLQIGLQDSQIRQQVPACPHMWSWLGYVSGNQGNRKTTTFFGTSPGFLHGETKHEDCSGDSSPQRWEEGEFWLKCLSTYRFSDKTCQSQQGVYLPRLECFL